MRRFLVVANQTLGGEHLIEKVRDCMSREPSSFYLLVPASPPHDAHAWSEGQTRAVAEQRLAEGIAKFHEIGAEVDGEVGDTNPAHAVGDVCLVRQFDEVIVSTLPIGVSRWLKQDLPHKIRRQVGVPVTHIVAEHADVSS